MSSEGEDYLDSGDVNEEYSFEDEDSKDYEDEEGYEGYEDGEENSDAEGEGEGEGQKYSEELEFEDIGEPATFNFNVHSGEPIYSLDFLKGTEFLATGSGDDRSLLIDARGLEVLADLGRAGDSVISVKFFQGSDGFKAAAADAEGPPVLLATASMDGCVRVYQSHPEQGIVLKGVFEGPGEGIECNWIDWHRRGPVLIAGYADGSVWMWNVALLGGSGGSSSGKDPLMSIFAGHVSTPATSGTFTPDGKTILIGSEEGVLLAYEARDASNPVLKLVPQAHQSTALQEITHLATHPTNQIFMAGDTEGHLRVYKTVCPDNMPIFDLSPLHSASIESIGFHPLGNLAVSAAMDGHAIIYDSHSTYQPRHNMTTSSIFGTVDSDTSSDDATVGDSSGFTLAKWLAAMPNGPALPAALNFGLLLGTAQGRLAIVEGRSGLLLRRLKGRPGRPVLDASVSVNGILAVAFDDGIISLYQL